VLWHRIAYDWRMTVEDLQERITSEYFTQLCAYLRKEPRGYDMDNWRAGLVASTVANASGRYQRKLKPSDFNPPKQKKLRLSKEQEQKLEELRGSSKRRNR